jgi:hypothetical protein
MQAYSDFFQTLHDEMSPTGYLGHGTHYSVLRAVVFHDPLGKPWREGQFADFAVIWDEDHDVRVMEPIEEIYQRGLLSSFLMFGEHRGNFTAILANEVSSAAKPLAFNPAFLRRVEDLNLSVRTSNCYKNADIVYIGDAVRKTEGEMLRTPPFGRKSLNEIKEVLAQMGLHLGMEVPGWPPENIEELAKRFEPHIDKHIEEYTKGKARVATLETEISTICQSLDDPWPSRVVALGSASNPIIDDEGEKVSLYLKNLEMLWQLGTDTIQRRKPFAGLGTAPPIRAAIG